MPIAELEGQIVVGSLEIVSRNRTDRKPQDDYDIHDIKRASLSVEGRPHTAAWIGRMSTLAA